MMQLQYLSFIGEGAGDKDLLGGKGFYLDQMTKMGLPVPEGFTITTEGYRDWVKNEKQISPDLEQQIREAVKELEKRIECVLGRQDAPLLVSVRSGAPVSMPGMMDTVLNVGATNESITKLAEQYQNPDFAWQTYQAFMQQYMEIIHGVKIKMEELIKNVYPSALLQYVGEMFVNQLKTEKDVKKIFLEKNNLPAHSLLDKYRVMSVLSLNSSYSFRLTGSHVSEMSSLSREEIRRGTITLVTEDFVKILWDGNGFEEIPYEHMGSRSCAQIGEGRKRVMSLLPQIQEDAEQYITELLSLGQLIPDTLRIRRQLSKIPEDPLAQILACVQTVFVSSEGNKAQAYREANNIPANLGTAVTIQRMVFGNIGPESGTAVCFSSCPKTGEKKLSGEYLIGQQGESLVSGQRTPTEITALREQQPRVYETLERLASKLEVQQGAVQDIEATWENPDKVYVLQTRNGILSPKGKVGFVLRQYQQGALKELDVIKLLALKDIEGLAHSISLDIPPGVQPLTKGKSIAEGIVMGRLALSKDEVQALEGETIVYCRDTTTPEDIAELRKSAGLLTIHGGEYCHAAVVARSMNKIALVGCEEMRIENDSVYFRTQEVKAGTFVTVDGFTGTVYQGVQNIHNGRASPLLAEVTRIARTVVADLPTVYYAQHPEDLKSIPIVASDGVSPTNHALVYSIDFACLQDSGVLEEFNRPEEISTKALYENGWNVYELLQKRGNVLFLTYEGLFDEQYKSIARDPWLMQWSFLAKINAHAKTDGKKIVYVSKDNPRLVNIFGKKSIQFCDALPFKTGQNCVLIKPWAVDESYFIAAKEALQWQT